MSIGATVWLWMLAAAVLPLIIHLWSRKSGQPKMLPTFRFLPDKNIARASRIELHEKTLLFLRILLILLITLLLAGLFIETNPRFAASVKLTESESVASGEWVGDDVLEINIPSKRIEEVGWWRILEQIEYDYRPDLVVVEGRLTADRFTGRLPELSAELEWIPTELPAEVRGPEWFGTEDLRYEYVQQRSDMRVENIVVEVSETAGSASDDNSFRLTISSDAGPEIKSGFLSAANFWNTGMTESELPPDVIARARFGERQMSLYSAQFSDYEATTQLNPGAQFGVSLSADLSDSTLPGSYLERRPGDDQPGILEIRNDDELVLQATPDKAVAGWYYAGVAHQLLKAAAGIDDTAEPELSPEQRSPLVVNEPVTATTLQKKAATHTMLFLLLIVWAAERILSNRRGM